MSLDLNDRRMAGEELHLEDGVDLAAPPADEEDSTQDAPNPFRERKLRPTRAWLSSRPPRRSWLLRRPGDNGGEPGFLPLGKVGMLAGSGGTGKTMALVQLAVSVATGRDWLGTFSVPRESTGPVLLALGEEDAEEVRRRLHFAFQAMWPSADLHQQGEREHAMKLVEQRIVVIPLAAVPVALVAADAVTREVHTTAALAQLLEQLGEGEAWRLVVIDPLSRFAGADTETDNASATRFVQAVERIAAEAPGHPTVMISHHVIKSSRRGDTPTDATSVRGASALVDGVRWAMTMVSEKASPDDPVPGRVRVELVKSNYGPPDRARTVKRTDGGALIALTGRDIAALANDAEPAGGGRFDS